MYFSLVSSSQKGDVKADEAAGSMNLKPPKHRQLMHHQISLGITIRKKEFLTSTVKNISGTI